MRKKWKKNKLNRANRGFTLIELVIVVAILAILVGILAPQYTKYVEKARKAADVSNMSELVRAVETYELDGTHQMTGTKYEIRIGYSNRSGTSKTVFQQVDPVGTDDKELKEELNNTFPNWESMTTKSKKWGDGVKFIQALITITSDGGCSVEYKPPYIVKSFFL